MNRATTFLAIHNFVVRGVFSINLEGMNPPKTFKFASAGTFLYQAKQEMGSHTLKYNWQKISFEKVQLNLSYCWIYSSWKYLNWTMMDCSLSPLNYQLPLHYNILVYNDINSYNEKENISQFIILNEHLIILNLTNIINLIMH